MNARRSAVASLCILIGMLGAARVQASPVEDELKLAFTYNIARFVSWPEAEPKNTDSFRLCVLGRDPQRIAEAKLARRRLASRRIDVVPLDEPSDADGDCDLIYVAASDAGNASDIFERIAESPVLTVSDAQGFADTGGIVELARSGDRIAMRINVDACRRAGLSISSQLLALATVVSDPGEEQP